MNYELAKQLKDAGFHKLELWDEAFSEKDKNITSEYDEQYIPTLSELIEACGEYFYELQRHKNGKFIAFPTVDVIKGVLYRGTDDIKHQLDETSTPEEAVAKLYLSLHHD